jgi:hypothetical protein
MPGRGAVSGTINQAALRLSIVKVSLNPNREALSTLPLIWPLI